MYEAKSQAFPQNNLQIQQPVFYSHIIFFDSLNNILFMGDWGYYDVFLNTVMIDITNVIC